jgi:CheY-like chemotaxis protein
MTAARTILIVDDNEANVALLEYLLKSCGYEVRSSVDAEAALVSIARHRPGLVLTDIQLPGASGLELTRRLKSDPATAGIRIVAISAFAMAADEQRALAAGCDGYVAKPIDTRTFPALVAEIIGPA